MPAPTSKSHQRPSRTYACRAGSPPSTLLPRARAGRDLAGAIVSGCRRGRSSSNRTAGITPVAREAAVGIDIGMPTELGWKQGFKLLSRPPGFAEAARGLWTVVPRVACDSMTNSPDTSFRRSFMLVRPSPRPRFAASTSKPTPSSRTVSSTASRLREDAHRNAGRGCVASRCAGLPGAPGRDRATRQAVHVPELFVAEINLGKCLP